MGANKPIEDIESCRVQADKSIHRARVNERRRLRSIKFIIEIRVRMNASVKRAWRRIDFYSLCDFVAAPVRIMFYPCDCSFQDRR
jgi:hypothetical protein